MHYHGCNWLVVEEWHNGGGSMVLRLRRYQDETEEIAPLVACSRPPWYC